MRAHSILQRSSILSSVCTDALLRSIGSALSCSQVHAANPFHGTLSSVASLQACFLSSALQSQHLPCRAEPKAHSLPRLADSLCCQNFHSSLPACSPAENKPKLSQVRQGKGMSDAGWTKAEVYNVPNALSMARLVSGPGIAWLIMNEQWGLALGSLVVSGASDWADGYVAKRYGQSSVLGSYLDPLADKVLIGCVVGALGYQGSLPVWLVTLIIGRDVALFSGAFVHRFHKVGWRWPGTTEFFRLSSPSGPETLTQQPEGSQTGSTTSSANLMYSTAQRTDHRSSDSSSSSSSRSDSSSQGQGTDGKTSTSVNASIAAISDIGSGASQQEKQEPSVGQEQARDKQSTQPAAFVQPLYISKVNTCFQLLLVGGCLSNSWYAWPSQEVMFYLGITVGCTTLASTAAYGIAYLQGKIK